MPGETYEKRLVQTRFSALAAVCHHRRVARRYRVAGRIIDFLGVAVPVIHFVPPMLVGTLSAIALYENHLDVLEVVSNAALMLFVVLKWAGKWDREEELHLEMARANDDVADRALDLALRDDLDSDVFEGFCRRARRALGRSHESLGDPGRGLAQTLYRQALKRLRPSEVVLCECGCSPYAPRRRLAFWKKRCGKCGGIGPQYQS